MAIQFFQTANFANSVTATSFVKSGGTSSQYLMADGSVSTGSSSVAWADITSKPTTISGFGITDAFSGSYADLTNVPSTFAPSAHNHDGTYLKLSGGTMTGDITMGGMSQGKIKSNGDLVLQVDADNNTSGAAFKLLGGGGGTLFKIVENGNIDAHGVINFTGTATTTSVDRGLYWTGFDKEQTTDFSDNASITHITNTGGHSGSVLEIKSMNDAGDGIAFTTHASSLLKHNGDAIFSEGHKPTWSEIDSKPSTFAPSAHNHAASEITSGTFATARIPNLAASIITSGTLDPGRLPEFFEEKFAYQSNDSNAVFTPMVKGGLYGTNNSSVTGAIRIDLPSYQSNAMVNFYVDIYEYSTGETVTFRISGYAYSDSGATWHNCSVVNLSDDNNDYNVRFVSDTANSKQCVIIGEVGTNWSYPQVLIRDAFGGYDLQESEWKSSWSISFVTSIVGTVRHTFADNLPYADWDRLEGKPSTFTPSSHNQAWSTITSTPTTISGYGITDAFSGNYNDLSNRPGIPTDFVSKANGGTFSGNITVDDGTSSTLWVKCDNGGNAIVRASGESQGTGALEVGQSTTYGGGISYNGDNSPAFVSGESSDHITFYRMSGGTRTEVFCYPYSGNTVTFNGDINVNGGNIVLGGTGRIQGIDTVSASTDAANKAYVDAHTYSHNHDSAYLGINAKAADSEKVDGIDSSRIVYGSGSNKINDLSNANASVPSGFYQYSSGSNYPTTGTWYNLINVRHSNTGNDHGFQIAASYYNEDIFTRTYQSGTGNDDGTYTTWRRLYHEGHKPTLSELGAASSSHNHDSTYVNVTGDTMSGQLITTKIATSHNSSQAAPRYDTSFYVAQSMHYYGHNGSQVMYLGESGNDVLIRGQVAIGGTAIQSGYNLTMTGSIDMNNNSIDYVNQLHFNDNVRFYDDGNDNYLNFRWGDTGAGGIRFRDGDYHVNGTVYGSGTQFGLLDGDGSWAVRIQNNSAIDLRVNNNSRIICDTGGTEFRNGGTVVGEVTTAGLARFANDVVAYYNFSDQRLKTDIKATTNNLDKILKLEPVEYTWKDGGREGKKEIGLIAQDVEKVVPEVVRENERLNDDTLYKQVDYEHLVSTLIGAIQEQQDQIAELKSEVTNLKSTMCKCKNQ